MEQQQDLQSCLVVWRGRKIVIEISPSATLMELGKKLQELTNVKADTLRLLVPKSSKLIYPFSDEQGHLSLETTLVLKGKSIRMMGVPKDEIDEVLQNAKVDLRLAGFDEEERRLKQRNADRTYTSQKLPQGTYIFCDFRTLSLPGIELNPPASKAMDLLHKLASDPGIVAIMNKHRWRVGILTEMAPVGYVGVSPMCILGVNKNQGEEISLRLRTDDLKGFRKYESIKKTLLHELAHMVFSEHDAKFYALDSQLNKEAATLDWTKSRGHTLTGATHSQHYDDEFDMSTNVTSSHKLGGQASILPNARLSSVNAAFERLANISNTSPSLSEEPNDVSEPDPDERECDKSMVVEPYMASGETHVNVELKPDRVALETERHEESNLDISEVNPIELDTYPEVQKTSLKLPSHVNSASMGHDESDSHVEEMQTEPASTEARPMSQTVDPNLDDDDVELQIIQDPVAMFCARLRNAIQSLKYEANSSETTTVLQTLIKIIRNVIENPEGVKFKKLRKSNPMIQRNIISFKAAMEILSMIGFSEDAVIDEWGKREVYLVLKRNDPGLWWLAKSTLETYMS